MGIPLVAAQCTDILSGSCTKIKDAIDAGITSAGGICEYIHLCDAPGCKADGECVSGGVEHCCNGTLHHTASCLAPFTRCGCLPDGACLADLIGADASDCCSGQSHQALFGPCVTSAGRVCGAKTLVV